MTTEELIDWYCGLNISERLSRFGYWSARMITSCSVDLLSQAKQAVNMESELKIICSCLMKKYRRR